MRTFIRWASAVYPATWRGRYGAEFDALLEDIAPSFCDLCDVLGHALRVRAAQLITSRLLVLASVAAHTSILGSLVLAAWFHVMPMPLNVATAPLPPPAPDPPPRITDPRVFPESGMLYSSLPLRTPADNVLFTSVVDCVGINFPPLPDAWATNHSVSPERRVWPGQALERAIVRRVLPDYPSGTAARGTVSVFIEYLIVVDGSVKVLRASGPAPFAAAARSAIERWAYRPIRCEDRPCEAVSRVEVRFDGDLAHPNVCDRPRPG